MSSLNEKLDRDLYIQLKQAFIKAAVKYKSKDQKYAHSLTYFIYLSIKGDMFFHDIFNFVLNEIQCNQGRIHLQMESVIIMIYSFARIQNVIGKNLYNQVR